jgi:hypothetical protein
MSRRDEMDEKTNVVIKEHETRTKKSRFSALSQLLYLWFKRFNQRFFDKMLRTPAVSFEKTRVNMLRHYVWDQNDLRFKWNININRRHLNRPIMEILGTLLHEMLHQWQETVGKRT